MSYPPASANYAGFPQTLCDYPPPANPLVLQQQQQQHQHHQQQHHTHAAAHAAATDSMTSSGFGGSSGADCKSAETSSILRAASYSSSIPNHDNHRFSAA